MSNQQIPKKSFWARCKEGLLSAGLIAMLFAPLGGVLVAPVPATAVAGVGDTVAVFEDLPSKLKWIKDAFWQTLKTTTAVAIKNSARAFLNQLAYDTATWIATGDKNQQPLLHSEGSESFIAGATNAAAGEFLNTIALENGLISIDLCNLPTLDTLKLNLLLPVIAGQEPKACNILDIESEWLDFKQSAEDMYAILIDDPTALVEITASYGSNNNALSTTLLAVDRLIGVETSAKEAAQIDKLRSDFRDVTGISGFVETPAALVEIQAYVDASRQHEAELRYVGDVFADALSVFYYTLASKYLQRITTGFLEYLNSPDLYQSISGYSGTSSSSAGLESADDQFAEFRQATFTTGAEVNILSELASCDTNVISETTCVISEAWRFAIEEGYTVEEAIEQGAINGDTSFIKDESGTEITTNVEDGLSLRSLKILAQYSIIPQLWVSAGEYISEFDQGHQTLQTLIDSYDNCSIDDYSPFCGLVDPEWTLKAPAVLCRHEGYGDTLVLDEYVDDDGSDYTPQNRILSRLESCLDPQSCLSENDSGFCELYGYCTEQHDIYRFEGNSCPAYYASCETFDNNDGVEMAYLSNTLNYADCDENVEGCQWRCTVYNEVQGAFQCTAQGEIYTTCDEEEGCDCTETESGSSEECSIEDGGFSCETDSGYTCTLGIEEEEYTGEYSLTLDDDAEECLSRQYGCSEFLYVKGEGENLLFNGGFDDVYTEESLIEDYTDTTASTYDLGEYLFGFSNSDDVGCVYGELVGECSGWEKMEDVPVRAVSNDFFDGNTAIQLQDQATASVTDGHITHRFDTGQPLENRSFVLSFYHYDPTSSDACTGEWWVAADEDSDGSKPIDVQAITFSSNDTTDDSGFTRVATDPITFEDGVSNTTIMVGFSQPSGCDIVLDAVKLEESASASSYTAYFEEPTYFNAAEAPQCEIDEIGCELYEPETGESDTAIAGIPTNPNSEACGDGSDYTDPSCSQCYEEYIGCDAYIEMPLTNMAPIADLAPFDDSETAIPSDYPTLGAAIAERSGYYCSETMEACNVAVGCGTEEGDCLPSISLTPSTAEQCKATHVGCEAYVNIDTADQGAEEVQHYSFLRQCVKPTQDQYDDDEIDTYFTWEGDDIEGYVLQSWELKKSNYDDGPCQYLGIYDRDNDVETAEANCIDAELINEGYITDVDCSAEFGDNPDCREYNNNEGTGPFYRYQTKTIIATDECIGLRNELDERIYYADLATSTSCPADQNMCREYKGSQGGNVRILLESDFEDAVWTVDDENTGGLASSDAVNVGGGSMAIGSLSTMISTEAYTEIDGELVEDYSYVVSFWAKDGEDSEIYPYFESASTGERLYFDDEGITLSNDWKLYSAGPFAFDEGEFVGDEYFGFEYSDREAYIDNVVLQQSNSHYLISGSFDTCKGYEGCEQYSDRDGGTHYLKSFDTLCSEDVVGCTAFIDTNNSDTPYYAEYNDDNEFGADDVQVPQDEVVAYIYDDQYACDVEFAGCTYIGTPDIDAYGEVESYDDSLIINDPDFYEDYTDENGTSQSGILCQQQDLMCDAWTSSDGSTVHYFKYPGDRTCTYDSDDGTWKDSEGNDCPLQNEYASPSQPKGSICDGGHRNGLLCNSDTDCPVSEGADEYNRCETNYSDDDSGWVGVCTDSYSGCTLYLDPNTDNELINGEYETDIADNDDITSEYNDGIPDDWYILDEGVSASSAASSRTTALTIDGTENVSIGDVFIGSGFTGGIMDEEDINAGSVDPSFTFTTSGTGGSVTENSSGHPSSAAAAILYIDATEESVVGGLGFEIDGGSRYYIPGFAPEAQAWDDYIAFYVDTLGQIYWADEDHNGLKADLSDAMSSDDAMRTSHLVDWVTVGDTLTYTDLDDFDIEITGDESWVAIFDENDFDSSSTLVTSNLASLETGAQLDYSEGDPESSEALMMGMFEGSSTLWAGIASEESVEFTITSEDEDLDSSNQITTYLGTMTSSNTPLLYFDVCGNSYWADNGNDGVNSSASDVRSSADSLAADNIAVIVDSECALGEQELGDTSIDVNGFYDAEEASGEIGCETFEQTTEQVAKGGFSMKVDDGGFEHCMLAAKQYIDIDLDKYYTLRGYVYTEDSFPEFSIGLNYFNVNQDEIVAGSDPDDYAIAAYEGSRRTDVSFSDYAGDWVRFHATIGPNATHEFPLGAASVQPFIEVSGSTEIFFDEIEFSENGEYTYINESVDGTAESGESSCNDQVSNGDGCVAFRDVNSLDANSLDTTSDVNDAEEIESDFVTNTCTFNSTDEELACNSYPNAADTNVVLKVRNDRECAEWLACGTASVDVSDETGEVTSVACSEVIRCREFHPDTGVCIDPVNRLDEDGLNKRSDTTVPSIPGNRLELDKIKNVAGYAKVGVEWIGVCNIDDSETSGECVGGANEGDTCSDDGACEESYITYGYYPYDWSTEVGLGTDDQTSDYIVGGDFEEVYCNGTDTTDLSTYAGGLFNGVDVYRDKSQPCTFDYHCVNADVQAQMESRLEAAIVDGTVSSSNGDIDYYENVWYGWCGNVDDDGDLGSWSTTSDDAAMHVIDRRPGVNFSKAADFVTQHEDFNFDGTDSIASSYGSGYQNFNNVLMVSPGANEANGVEYTLSPEIVPGREYTVSFDGRFLDTPDDDTDFIEVGFEHGLYSVYGTDYFASGSAYVDIVFAVEASSEMSTYISEMANNMEEFHATFAAEGIVPRYFITFTGAADENAHILDFFDYSSGSTSNYGSSNLITTGYTEDYEVAKSALSYIANNPIAASRTSYEMIEFATNGIFFHDGHAAEYRSGADRVMLLFTQKHPGITEYYIQNGSDSSYWDHDDEQWFIDNLLYNNDYDMPIYGLFENSEKYSIVEGSVAPSEAFDEIVDYMGGVIYNINDSSVEEIALSVAENLEEEIRPFTFTEEFKRYTLGPIIVTEKDESDDTTKLFIRQQEGAQDVPFIIDNVSLKPALEVNKEDNVAAPTKPNLLSRRCRGYVEDDYETCDGNDGGIVYTGWKGYCLVPDPWNKDRCISWWPVDTIAAETNIISQSKTAADYGGESPAYHCLVAKGNENLGACEDSGYMCSGDSDCDSGESCIGNSGGDSGDEIEQQLRTGTGETSYMDITHTYTTNNYTITHTIDELTIDSSSHTGTEPNDEESAVFLRVDELPVEQLVHVSEIDNIYFDMGDPSYDCSDGQCSKSGNGSAALQSWRYGTDYFETKNLEEDGGDGYPLWKMSKDTTTNTNFLSKGTSNADVETAAYVSQRGIWCSETNGEGGGLCDENSDIEDFEDMDVFFVKAITTGADDRNITASGRVGDNDTPYNVFIEGSNFGPDSELWTGGGGRGWYWYENDDGSTVVRIHQGTAETHGSWTTYDAFDMTINDAYWYGRFSDEHDNDDTHSCWSVGKENSCGANIVAVNFDFEDGYLEAVYLVYWDGMRRFDVDTISDIKWKFELKEPCLVAVESADENGETTPWYTRTKSDSDYQVYGLGYTYTTEYDTGAGTENAPSFFGALHRASDDDDIGDIDGEADDITDDTSMIEFTAEGDGLPQVRPFADGNAVGIGLPYACLGDCDEVYCQAGRTQGSYDGEYLGEGGTCEEDKWIGVGGICRNAAGEIETDSGGNAILCDGVDSGDDDDECDQDAGYTCREISELNERGNGEGSYYDQVYEAAQDAWYKYRLLFPEVRSVWLANYDGPNTAVTNGNELTNLDANSGLDLIFGGIFDTFDDMDLCPAEGRPDEDDVSSVTELYCAIRPEVDEIQVQSQETGDIVLANGTTASLLFDSDVDADQLPLQQIFIEWEGIEGDAFDAGTTDNWEAADKNNHYYTHVYTCDPTQSSDNYSTTEALQADGVDTSNIGEDGACVYELRIQLEDNWGFCSGSEEDDSYADYRIQAASDNECDSYDVYDGKIYVLPN